MKRQITLIAFASFLTMLFSCDHKLEDSCMVIVDNHRHYFPVAQGTQMNLKFEIRDTCDIPLYIEEIQPSAGLSFVGELPVTVLPHESADLCFVFNTNKNIGYVNHYINLYANLPDSAYRTIYFDINVVLPPDYYHDYEQRYTATADGGIGEFTDGKAGEKGYITDEGIEDRSRETELEHTVKDWMKR